MAAIDIPVVDIYDFATEYERKLYAQHHRTWGDEATRARRGARLLDRAMPDWHDRVEFNTLEMSAVCKCVLGQIWAPTVDALPSGGDKFWTRLSRRFGAAFSHKAREVAENDRWSLSENYGYGLGALIWGLKDRPEGKGSLADFYGFDVIDGSNGYDPLNVAWKKEIAKRQKTAA